MAKGESAETTESKQQKGSGEDQLPNAEEEMDSGSESDESSDSDDDYTSEPEPETESKPHDDADTNILSYTRPTDIPVDPNIDPETNIRRYTRVLESMQEEEDEEYVCYEDLFDFPKDPERWTEEDLREKWVDAPWQMTKPGWDPAWADEEDWDIVEEEIQEGRDPGIEPFYVPYRKPYPVIPEDNYDVSNAKAVVEELDRIEEFMNWVSYIFPDGSSYEGTVWDDLAQGRGVYIAENGLVRYEGEWLQNDMEGHGVIEVDIPDIEPIPGSKLEAKMRAEGRIIKRDFMSPEDRKWLEMDVEDSVALTDGRYEVPFYENEEWVRMFGEKPEKGRYRYAGQWKHGRMHGCGVYEVNDRVLYGRFYFGELLEEEHDCDADVCALHSGLAEVAAAKARMFVNKPDGMVREDRGPFNDPQHPYFYEDDDVWMAPGFINQFYEVPDYWKTYVHEVDQEREMWLNSFYKAPLRLPMPAELEYWWQNVEVAPEFVLLNKEPEPDPNDPSKLVYTEDPLILHTPTGRIINYVDDEKHGVRLFWQPPLEDGEDVDPSKAQFLPLGFDEFYGKEVVEKKEHPVKRFVLGIEKAVKPFLSKIEKWTEEKKKASEMKIEMIRKELDLVEAEICLEEAIEDLDEELKRREKEEEKKTEMGFKEMNEDVSVPIYREEKAGITKQKEEEEEEDEDEDEDDDDDNLAPSSFGSVDKDEKKNTRNGNSPFSSSTLSSFTSCTLFPMVQSRLQQSFLAWKQNRTASPKPISSNVSNTFDSIHFPQLPRNQLKLKTGNLSNPGLHQRNCLRTTRSQSQLASLSLILSGNRSSGDNSGLKLQHLRKQKEDQIWLLKSPVGNLDGVLSLHIPTSSLDLSADSYVLS